MSSSFDTSNLIASNFRSELSTFSNKSFKDKEITKFHKEVKAIFSVPVFFGFFELYLRLSGKSLVANRLSIVNGVSILVSLILVRDAQNRLEKRLNYVNLRFPGCPQSQIEAYKSADINNLH